MRHLVEDAEEGAGRLAKDQDKRSEGERGGWIAGGYLFPGTGTTMEETTETAEEEDGEADGQVDRQIMRMSGRKWQAGQQAGGERRLVVGILGGCLYQFKYIYILFYWIVLNSVRGASLSASPHS